MSDMVMSIAGTAMAMQQASLLNSANVLMMGKAMDSQKLAMDTLLGGMPQPPQMPSFGHELDVLA